MKILSAILAILILFLTVQPLLTNSTFIVKNPTQTVHKCCPDKYNTQSSKSEKESKKNNNCCNNGHCNNPFLNCSNCYFTDLNKLTFSVAAVFKEIEKIRLTNDKALSSYIQNFWHLPNLA